MISIVIPVYNEEQAIGSDLDEIQRTMAESGQEYEIIVVDDGSTDRSAEIVKQREGVRLIQHERNRGTGAARSTGIRCAHGDIVVMTDGDGTYPARDIPRLVSGLEDSDMVIGARKRETGSFRWLRTPAKNFIRWLACYLTEVRIPDLNSGLRAFRREIVERYLPILPTTHSWVSTITIALLSDQYRVKWVPIEYYKRIGHSTFHPIRDTYNYLSLVIRSIMLFNPLKVFLPTSLILGAVGFGKMIYDIFAYNFHFAPSTVTVILTAIQVGAMGLLADLIVRRSRL
jgi:glycosyltransferase involved in cell wall biosynthesis